MDRVSKAERELVRKMQKQTRADRIRALSDEELAEAFARQCAGRVCVDGVLCKECWLDWLRQEAHDDH